MRFIVHVLMFALGGALGIWWGVGHPMEAQNLAAKEQQIAAKAKIEVLSQLKSTSTAAPGAGFVGGGGTPTNDKINQMLDQSKKELNDANSKLQTP